MKNKKKFLEIMETQPDSSWTSIKNVTPGQWCNNQWCIYLWVEKEVGGYFKFIEIFDLLSDSSLMNRMFRANDSASTFEDAKENMRQLVREA